MFKNHLKIAWRNLIKNRGYSAINIFGLVLGFSTCILLLGYVKFETSYEHHIKNADDVYRVTTTRIHNDKIVQEGAKGPTRLAVVIEDLEGIKSITRAFYEPCLMRVADKKFSDQKVYWVDKGFLNVFKGILISGNPDTALDGPLKMVITESKALALFGNENPMGKVVKVNEGMPFQITGVVKDPPANTHLKYDYLNSLETFVYYQWTNSLGNWHSNSRYTYLKLATGQTKQRIESAINQMVLTHVNPENNAGNKLKFKLQPIRDIHLNSNYTDEPEINGDIHHIYIVLGIGLGILIIVFINFINLSTALSLKRSKDTGVRKTFGATNNQIKVQFLIEGLLLNLIAVLGAAVLVFVSQSTVSSVLNISFDFAILSNLKFWLWAGLFFAFCVVGVGFYPAVVISSFNPVTALKGKISNGKTRNNRVKQALLVCQFTASLFLIIAAFIVSKQVNFMKNHDLGITTEQVLIMRGPTTLNAAWNDYEKIAIKTKKYNLFKQEILQNTSVKNIGCSVTIPGQEADRNFREVVVEKSGEKIDTKINVRNIDYGFLPIYEATFLSGKNFEEDISERRMEIVINQKASKILGFTDPNDAIDQIVKHGNSKWKIIGVVADFHMKSLTEPISPVFFINRHPSEFGYYLAKLNTDGISKNLAIMEAKWNEIYPEDPFMTHFSDTYFNQQYVKHEQFGNIFNFLTALAILIANLGLIAMVSLLSTQKLKEIGIRRVLGAGWKHVLVIMSKSFMKIIAISALIAFPVSWYFLKNWLEGFAYKIELHTTEFIGSAIFIAIIALLNILYFVVKILKYNPISIIREE